MVGVGGDGKRVRLWGFLFLHLHRRFHRYPVPAVSDIIPDVKLVALVTASRV